MTPVTFEPVCVNTTSPPPKSLPVVHHLPSMLAAAPVERLLEVLALDERALAFGVVELVAGFVGLLTGFAAAAEVTVPPAA